MSERTLAMISWIFSSCDSASSTLRTCWTVTFSLYPSEMISSKAAMRSNAWWRMVASSGEDERRRSEMDRVISDSVEMSCRQERGHEKKSQHSVVECFPPWELPQGPGASRALRLRAGELGAGR